MPEVSKFILDTHVWIWLVEDTGTLSKTVVGKINQAAKHKNILIAAISLWEVAMLIEKQRVECGSSAATWLSSALSHPGVSLCPLTPMIAAESCSLPGNFHGDPSDRLIVSTARRENATLITRDENILRYSKGGHVRCLKA